MILSLTFYKKNIELSLIFYKIVIFAQRIANEYL